jgi:hypothetical protein
MQIDEQDRIKTKGLIGEHSTEWGSPYRWSVSVVTVQDCRRLLASRLDSVGESDDTERLMPKSLGSLRWTYPLCWKRPGALDFSRLHRGQLFPTLGHQT